MNIKYLDLIIGAFLFLVGILVLLTGHDIWRWRGIPEMGLGIAIVYAAFCD